MPTQNLRIPGPTPVPEEALAACARPMINHRGPEFKAMFGEIVAGLKAVFRTRNDVLIFPAASTGAMEASVVNVLSPGDRVLAVTMGYFGDRYARIAADYGADVVKLEYPWGQAANPDDIDAKLAADPAIKAVLVTYNETSTGVTNDLAAIARLVRGHERLLLVDAVSALGAIPLLTDEWDIDIVVTGSQKALMIPPGLGILSVGPRAWVANATAKMPRHYWDFGAAKKYQDRLETPYTPALPQLYALQVSLRLFQAEGYEAVMARHRAIGRATRAGVQALGLELLCTDPARCSDAVTAARAPAGVDGKALPKMLREEHGVVIAGGQGPLEGKIIRIGHLGWVHLPDIVATLEALEAVLSKLGHGVTPGAARKAAEEAAGR